MACDNYSQNFGNLGEEVLRQWLKERGYYLVPTSLIDRGGAPLLEGHLRQFVLPDILAAKSGISSWVDAKSKRRATKNRKRGRWETGCALRHWNDYRAVATATGISGALAFIHAQETRLYFASLETLAPTMAVWDGPVGQGHAFTEPMAFFALDAFEAHQLECGRIVTLFKDASQPPKTVRPWEPEKPPDWKYGELF